MLGYAPCSLDDDCVTTILLRDMDCASCSFTYLSYITFSMAEYR